MTKASNAADFLQNMTDDLAAIQPPGPQSTEAQPRKQSSSTRVGLKHIGGYLDADTVEKVAVLRARLGLDNSGLIKLAVDDLHRKHMAKRAFGEA
jgi:hypothetical protein